MTGVADNLTEVIGMDATTILRLRPALTRYLWLRASCCARSALT